MKRLTKKELIKEIRRQNRVISKFNLLLESNFVKIAELSRDSQFYKDQAQVYKNDLFAYKNACVDQANAIAELQAKK